MILITSGQYVSADLISNVGELPPTFLPVGGKRLYEYQLELFENLSDDIYLSLPKSFKPTYFDCAFLKNKNIKIIYSDESISLGRFILNFLDEVKRHDERFVILHGDTLFDRIDHKLEDTISLNENKGFNHRAQLLNIDGDVQHLKSGWVGDDRKVLSGYFCFSSIDLYRQALNEAKTDFIKSITSYNYIRPINFLENSRWLDFGHVNTYFEARSSITTQRYFNDLLITPRTVTKKSINKVKMEAEYRWYKNIPEEINVFLPSISSLKKTNSHFSYKLEYLYLIPLNDLFVFGELNSDAWVSILSECKNFLDVLHTYEVPSTVRLSSLDGLYQSKTHKRMNSFHLATGFNLERKLSLNNVELDSLSDIANITSSFINKASKEDVCISHGDFCFSNILYDSRSRFIKVIDPRGIDSNNNISIYGDKRYDIAKLYHSIIGLYDYIISSNYYLKVDIGSGNYTFEIYTNVWAKSIQNLFKQMILVSSGYSELEIQSICIHLFLSMLPLHSDCERRQDAIIANVLTLFADMKKQEGL